MENLYWISLIAVIVLSASGVLKAGFKQFDLFSVIIIAIATGLAFISLLYFRVDVTLSAVIAGLSIFIARLLLIQFNLSLPRFRFNHEVFYSDAALYIRNDAGSVAPCSPF